jgi:hypothetical protein
MDRRDGTHRCVEVLDTVRHIHASWFISFWAELLQRPGEHLMIIWSFMIFCHKVLRSWTSDEAPEKLEDFSSWIASLS